MMKAPGGGGVAPPNMLTGQPLGSGSPPPDDSPMGGMHGHSGTPNSQGQMSPGPSIGPPSNHSPQHHGHQQQHQHHQQQQPHHLQQQQHHPHSHPGHPGNGGYGHVPQATPSPGGHGDMSPSHHHMHHGGGSPPGWHSIHQQQDIKPPMNPAAAAAAAAAHGMFPQYSWYQTTDNNMNQGLLT